MDRARSQRFLVILAAALLMTWPAWYNGFALLYPDSMSYLQDGARAARAFFLGQVSYTYGRSPLYSLVILPLHRTVTPWPVVALNALLTAYVLWLVVRSLVARRTLLAYASLVGVLSLVTGLAWFASQVMPDILGPLAYLCIYLMVFAWDSLARAERVAVPLIAWWAIASHASHLLLAAGLCAFLALFLRLRHLPARPWLAAVGRVAAVVGLAVAAELASNTFLYGKPSLNGRRPPFLLARVIADGPGRRYLERHCGAGRWTICDHLHELPDNVASFLWTPGGIWSSASNAEQDRLREDEAPVVLGTVRAYPGRELRVSAAHFWAQLHTFGLSDYAENRWVLRQFDTVLPGARASYLRSRQARDALPEELFASIQDWAVVASLVVILVGFWTRGRRHRWSRRLVGLAAVVAFVVVANAAVTGVLSNVEDRYQARVIWLVPLLAGIVASTWAGERRRDGSAPTDGS